MDMWGHTLDAWHPRVWREMRGASDFMSGGAERRWGGNRTRTFYMPDGVPAPLFFCRAVNSLASPAHACRAPWPCGVRDNPVPPSRAWRRAACTGWERLDP
eukprot:4685464-Prymnesium_polylepis.3